MFSLSRHKAKRKIGVSFYFSIISIGVVCFSSVKADEVASSFYESQSIEPVNARSSMVGKLFYPASKEGVMRLLDSLRVDFRIDQDGDLVYDLNHNDWHGYIIFSELGNDRVIWNLQVRTQFSTKPQFYAQLLKFTNDWNASQKMPKIAMKSSHKMVLSINYPVQFGFNPKEFEVNVFKQLNRSAKTIFKQIEPMIMINGDGR